MNKICLNSIPVDVRNTLKYKPPINKWLYGYYSDLENDIKDGLIEKIVVCKYKKLNNKYYKRIWFECINNDLNNLIECNRPLFWKEFEV